MELDKNQLNRILAFIKIVKDVSGCEDFISELRAIIGNSDEPSVPNQLLLGIDDNIKDIRRILQIQASPSISYNFIPNNYELLRKQLEIDNLRMEQSILDLQVKSDVERFYNFCIYAFYQIENLVNYYYQLRFPNVLDLIQYLEDKSQFKHDAQSSIAELPISTKLWVFCTEHFPSIILSGQTNRKDYTGYNICKVLREIRNEGLHRCHAIFKDEQEASKTAKLYLYNFYKWNSVNNVRNLVIKVVDVVKII